MDYEALLEVLKTDIRAQIALTALLISLYTLFKNSHKEKDHIEVILEKPIYKSEHIYAKTKEGNVKKDNIKSVIHGNIIINNASKHNIGFFGLELRLDNELMFILKGDSFRDSTELLDKTLGANYFLIATEDDYISGNVEERSQRRILFVATGINDMTIPKGENIKIEMKFLKANIFTSLPFIKKWVPMSKKVTFKYKTKNLKYMTSDYTSGKFKIKRI